LFNRDSDIRLIDLNNLSNVTTLSGHSKSVKSLAFDPRGEFLISAGCDETLRIWELKSNSCIKVLENLIDALNGDDFDAFTIAWQRNGKYFAVPGRKSDILLIQRDSWKIVGTFKGTHIKVIMSLFSSVFLF
jgi:chromosome transmission fidelity protein 4